MRDSTTDVSAAATHVVGENDLPNATIVHLAEHLAQTREATVLSRLLARLPADERATELAVCLAHEMIVRGQPVADAFLRRLHGHPLADLPLHLLPAESRLPLEDEPRRGDPITFAGVAPVVSREDTPPDVTAAVIEWVRQSDGRAEGALFTLASPLAPAEVGMRTIEALDLQCLAGGGLLLWPADLEEVVAALFDAAAHHGAYLGAAYGRAAMWRSVSALAGGSPEDCSWWTFTAANDWFRDRDVGVVCLRAGGHVMAVLAATDTD